ncbi:hypothetical protein KP509_31G023200 [Ceratopteris richardii]|uniref:Uncharacterized protein n=1 Tax=Ceratopteris richardii TaxID=49495 RepID=A0A8T2QY34_CERRI|nr:hypothetical protein KP509_31G023200 [Ceratopteris richardii]
MWRISFVESLRRLHSSWQNIFSRGVGHRHVHERTIEVIYEDVKACGYNDVQVMWSILTMAKGHHEDYPSFPASPATWPSLSL